MFWNYLTHLKYLNINLLRAKSVRWQKKHTHSFIRGLTGRRQIFAYKSYAFFDGYNAFVLPLQHFCFYVLLFLWFSASAADLITYGLCEKEN